MANNIIRRTWKQGGMVNIEDLRGSAFQAEDGGHTFLISGVDENGDALALSGTPAGVLLRADGQDVTLTCSVSDGVVSATLPANAYVVPGRIGITIFLTNGGQKTAIYAAIAAVATTSSGTVAPPAGADVVTLVNAIETAISQIPASDTNLKGALAPTYSTSAVYAVGSYAWYDGKLYKCTTAITSGETWTSAHWTLANLGSDVNDLKSAFEYETQSNIDFFEDKIGITNYIFKYNDNKAVKTSVDVINIDESTLTAPSSSPWKYCIIPCQEGDIFNVKINSASSNYRPWAFIQSDGTKISAATSNNVNVDLTAPANSAYLVCNVYIASSSTVYTVTKGKNRLDKMAYTDKGLLSDLEYTALINCHESGVYRSGASYVTSITDLPIDYDGNAFNLFVTNPAFANDNFAFQKLVSVNNSIWGRTLRYLSGEWIVYPGYDWSLIYDGSDVPIKHSEFETYVFENNIVNVTNTINYYWNIEAGLGGTAVKTSISSAFYASDPIPVSAGQVYKITACQGSTDKARIWVTTDDNYNIISMAENHRGTSETTESFVIPENATLLILCGWNEELNPQVLYKQETAFDIMDAKLKGKKLSLLGDSISAYAGTIPEGNDAYYNGSRAGVTSPNQMWWKILCDKTGMIPLIINGWSGSGVNWQTDSSHTNKVPMSDDSRCKGLHDGNVNPDVVLIAGGVNDYSYAESAQNEPLDWDGKTAPGYTEPSTGKIVYNSFTEAYVAMIKKIQERYPDAIVVALATWFTMRGTDNGYTLTHTVGNNVYTQQDYNDKIKYVAEQMHIPYIDVSNIGFNRNNFYPTYASDSSTVPTHPNASGQYVMGSAVAEKIIALVEGYLN